MATCEENPGVVFTRQRFSHLLEDLEPGSDSRVAVGSQGERILGPALTDQVVRIRNGRISGEAADHVSDVTDDLKKFLLIKNNTLAHLTHRGHLYDLTS